MFQEPGELEQVREMELWSPVDTLAWGVCEIRTGQEDEAGQV